MVDVASRVASAKLPWLTLEEELSPDMTSHITGLEAMLTEMQLRVHWTSHSGCLWNQMEVSASVLLKLVGVLQVPVAFWSVEATLPAWAEAHGELEVPDDSLEDLMEVEVVSNKIAICFQPPCCGLGCVG